jgi:hypothetical protein
VDRPLIYYTHLFLFFSFLSLVGERERYFSIGCAGHHVQEPKPKKDPPPYTITPADDDDQQQSKRVIDIIHIRQVPKGGERNKKTNHSIYREIVQPPLIIISTKRI